MAKDDIDIGAIVLLGLIAGGIVYKDKIIDWFNHTCFFNCGGGVGTCPAGTHKNSAGQCVPDGCTKTCNPGQHPDAACKNCVPDSNGNGNGNGNGGGSTGTTWYKANGAIAKMPWIRQNMGNCGKSSSNSGGNRWENDSPGFMDKGLEVVAYITIKAGKMCNTGGHVGLKHGGPNHKSCGSGDKIPCGSCNSSCSGSGCCCWWDSGAHNDGVPYLEIERPHACNIKTKTFPKLSTKLDTGRPIGFRWHISREGSGIRLMMWIDNTSGKAGGNQWKQIYNVLDTGQLMPTSYINRITKAQNVEIRVSDVAGGDITMHSANARKIN